MSRPRISVIVPTLNEEGNLPHVLPRIPAFVDEVVLVDGHSVDGTVQAARDLLPDIRVVMQEGAGKGAALRTGFAAATGDILVMLDADGSTDPGEIPYFVHVLLAGADFAKGSRFLHGAGTSDMPFHRRWGNAAFVHMVRGLYGGQYTDLCYGYNAFWRRVLPMLDLDGDGFEIETMMNIRALRAGLRIVEVPSFEDRRVMGVGRLRTIPDGWRVLRTIWSERRRSILGSEELPWTGDPSNLLQPVAALVPVPINGHGHDSPVPVTMNGHGALAPRTNGNGHAPLPVLGLANGHSVGSSNAVTGNGHVPSNGHATNGNGQVQPAVPAGNGHAPIPPGLLNMANGAIAEPHGPDQYTAIPVGRAIPDDGSHGTWQTVAGDYIYRLQELIARVDRQAIAMVVEEMRAARDRGATIFLAGNGGSSATAAHWVNDLGKATKASGRPPMRVMNLSDNVPWLTALGNDEGIDRVFAGQLENFARPGDVVVVISASGNSPNILRLLESARGTGLRTIGLVGFDGGAALPLLDQALWVQTERGAYGLVETAHSALADIVTTCLINDRVRVPEPSH
jgi:phosphoheptose isomerase